MNHRGRRLGEWRICLDPDGILIRDADDEPLLFDCRAEIDLLIDGKSRPRTLRTQWRWDEESRDPDQNAVRLLSRQDGLTLKWSICGEETGGLRITLQVTNTRSEPVIIDSLIPLTCRLPGDTGQARFFRPGFQSWSPSGSIACSRQGEQPRLRWAQIMSLNHRVPYGGPPGRHVCDGFTLLSPAPEQPSMLLGFTSFHRGYGLVEIAPEPSPPGRRITARCSYDGIALPAEAALRSEPLLLFRSLDPQAIRQRYTDLVADNMHARTMSASISGWCSWYYYYRAITPDAVRRSLKRADEFQPLDVFQIDDGYQSRIGDWLVPGKAFRDAFPALPREIAAAGLQPGIWTAPFLAEKRSQIMQNHRDWLLKDRRGRPLCAGINPAWRARVFALDPTHPDFLRYLSAVFKRLRKMGFTFFKLDFTYAGMMTGVRHDASLTPVQAFRLGLQTIREAVGDDAFLLGCGMPLGPAVGLVDAMRISPDTDPSWDNRKALAVTGIRSFPAARNALAGIIHRAYLHRRWWNNDPDCLMVRSKQNNLTHAEQRTLFTMTALNGGMLLLSEDLAALSTEERELAVKAFPVADITTEAPGWLQHELPAQYLFPRAGGSRGIIVINWAEPGVAEALPEIVTLPDAEPMHVIDVWNQSYHGIADRSLPVGELELHGCRFWWLVPVREYPQALGADWHILPDMGMEQRWIAEERRLAIAWTVAGRRRGRIAIALPHHRQLPEIREIAGLEIADQWLDEPILWIDAVLQDVGGLTLLFGEDQC